VDYKFDDVDPEFFREMSKGFRNNQKQKRREEIIDGIKPSPDKNWDKISHKMNVIVRANYGPIIYGTVRMAFEKDAYVVENEDGEIITLAMMRPNLKITSHKPYIFDITTPNHRYVYLNEKDMEMAEIGFLLDYIEKNKLGFNYIFDKTKFLLEKYPEEFI